jgi:plasmid maintenance system antidote protein VapI
MTQKAVAKLVGVAPGRIHAILTNSQRDEGDEG